MKEEAGEQHSHHVSSRAWELGLGLWSLVRGMPWTGKAQPATSSWTLPTGKNHAHFSPFRSHAYLFYLPQEPFLSTSHEDAPSGLVNEVNNSTQRCRYEAGTPSWKTYFQVENGTQDARTCGSEYSGTLGVSPLLPQLQGPPELQACRSCSRCFIQGTHVTCFKQSLLHMLSDTKELHVFGAKNVPFVSS